MAKVSNTQSVAKPGTAVATHDPEKEAKDKAHMARCSMSAAFNAAAVVHPLGEKVFGKLDFIALGAELSKSFEEIKANDLSRVEAALFGQATSLQSIFTGLIKRAITQDDLKAYEVFMRLALKAQSQSRATLETLAALKNPTSPTFVKQANIANGPQQVNNCATPPSSAIEAPTCARKEIKSTPNGLLEVTHSIGQQVDHLLGQEPDETTTPAETSYPSAGRKLSQKKRSE